MGSERGAYYAQGARALSNLIHTRSKREDPVVSLLRITLRYRVTRVEVLRWPSIKYVAARTDMLL